MRGVGSFVDPHHVRWRKPPAAARTRPARSRPSASSNCIIAAGSQAVQLPFLPKDPRIVDSTGALELRQMPKRMLIVGGGIIGLEMGTVYSTLGARLDVVEMLDGLMQGADRDLVKVWQKMNAPRFDNIMLKTKTVGAEATKDGIRVQLRRRAGAQGAAALRPGAAGRRPQPQRQEDRRRQGRRDRQRPRLHPGRHADAHQRAAHLRDRRHRRPADAGAQGGARGARGGRGGRRRAKGDKELASALRCARDPERGLHRPRGGLGRPDRGRGQGRGHRRSRRACSRGPPRAAPSPTAATKASPSCCSTTRRTASSAAASSARMPAT